MASEFSFAQHKRMSVRVAKELLYGEDVVDAIKADTSVVEIDKILYRARHNARKSDVR